MEVRNQIIDAYNRCDGKAIMAKLAAERPVDFMRIVVQSLPKQDREDLEASQQRELTVMIQREPDPDEILDLIKRCLQLADGKPVTREVVMEAIRQQVAEKRERSDSP